MIAVTGLACRFPGAPDAASFWDMLVAGRDGLTRFTQEELAARGVPRRLRTNRDYVPVGGLISGQDLFDPEPFGLTDAEAALLDPQQRLFLEVAWQALEQAGHGCGLGAGSVGVFAGAAHSSYLTSNLSDRWSPTGGGADPVGSLQTAMATHADYLPLQVAYRLNLTGPAIAVNSTCSTSLVAVHTAAQSLLNEECDTALAGGVSLIVPQGHGYLHVADGIYSVDGRVRPFSSDGSGIVYSQGVGAVVLRRLEDALADGDPVLAVLRGSAVNNDGADKAGFTAPSLRGQARVIAEAQAVAGIDPRQVGYVEAHGTATRLGDPVETAALRRIFGEAGPAWCGLGSVKGNIGHANTAAGIAAFIKTTLGVQHRLLPASPHAEPINDLLELDGSPFEVVTGTKPWEGPGFAGVSSFGIGGTNCHAVLGPAPDRPAPGMDRRPQILTVSAHSRAAVEHTAAGIAAAESVDAADLAHTLQSGRPALPHRIATAARDGDIATALRGETAVRALPARPRVVFAFPGAGSQYPGMGSRLYAEEPVFRNAVDECAELLHPLLGTDIREAVVGEAAQQRVRDAAFGLPALFAVSLATARLLDSWGVRPEVVLGHSLGEYTAAVVAGGLTVREAARLVAVRCIGASRAAGGGSMLAVQLGEAAVVGLLAKHPQVDLAAVNAPDSCVVSGPRAAIDELAAHLTDQGSGATQLRVDAALHSRLVEPAMPALRTAASGLRSRPLAVPMVTTVTGAYADAELGTADHWVRQLRTTVRFSEALQTAVESDAPAIVLQVGPGSALAGLARRNGLSALHTALTTFTADEPDEAVAVRDAVGKLWAHGLDVDFAAQHTEQRRRIAAPGYAFQRRRLWTDPPEQRQRQAAEIDATEPLQIPRWQQLLPLDQSIPLSGRWMLVGDADDGLFASARQEMETLGASCVSFDELRNAVDVPFAGVVVLTADEDAEAGVLRHAELANALAGLESLPPLLLQVTRGAEQIDGRDLAHPAQAALRVLPRVLGQELRGLRWRTVDLPHGCDETAAVVAELADLVATPGSSGDEVAVRGESRWLRTVVPWQPSPGGTPAPADGIALITGGLGDVGLTMAEHLAGAGYRVVITSRTGLVAHPEPRSVAGQRLKAVRRLTDAGAEVEVRALDAADEPGTAALLKELAQRGRLEIVIHAAGVVASTGATPLRETTAEHVSAHVTAKATGALALRAAIDLLPADRRPRAVVLMSSVTTLVGGIGMGPYAAANGFLDGLAMAAGGGPTRWVSAVWDGWRVGPLGAERTVALDHALDADTGMAALDRILAGATPPVVAIAATGLADRMARSATITEPTAAAPGQLADPVEREIAALWSELFGSPVTSAEADFFLLGGHSLLATRMLAAMRERFGVELRLRDLLAQPTVAALATYISTGEPVQRGPEPDSTVGIVTAADGTFPLTRVQHAYWVGRDGGYQWGDVPCHFYLEYDCEDLDIGRYERAWNRVLARHPMLRAVITAQGRTKVLDHVPTYRIRVHDLTALPDDRCAARLESLRERISRQPGPADRWPLAQIQAARLPGGRVRLFIGVDVLVCDAASWWVIDRELRHFYCAPDQPLPEVGIDFASCVAALEQRRRAHRGEQAAAYWRGKLDSLPGAPALPVHESEVPARFVRHAAKLDPATWSALQAEAARRRVTPTAVLLTAYAETLAAWSGSDQFGIVLTLFDRPDIHPQVSEVVGDFTSLVLHAVDHSRPGSFLERARAAQDTLFADLDHRDFSALEVLAEQSSRLGHRVSVPVVFTSALGLQDVIGAEHDPEWVGTQVAALSQTPQTLLDHQALEQGGRLLLQWDALEPALAPDQVDRAFADYVRRVEELAINPSTWDSGEVADEDIAMPVRPSGAGRTLFLMHPSGGDVVCYAELARLLDDRVNVVALTDPELVDGSGAADIAGMAGRFLDIVRRSQPHGPYLLGGWSMGGDLAQEMARRLHALGERTELLVLLDSNDPSYITHIAGTPDEVELAVIWRFLGALEGFVGADLGAGPDLGTSDIVETIRELPNDRRWDEIDRRLCSARLLGRRDSARRRVAVFARHLRALADHEPGRLPDETTRTLLIRADRPAPRNSGVGMGVDDTPPGLADLGWGRYLAGPLDVIGVDANHYSLLHPPAMAQVAAAINEALKTALNPR
ncbi:SDR family NAD(P)-dependent oxidoreductase [Saccharopolyspora sp. K220]|uniref:type I polyketide synthase n=1 Tax=Saccharopolyspora soli TaxID=2926618 RepID=UPI001F57E1CE|nr:type I polyketide synthase [Saccharopolyspora soli]MCI2419787.1 SDR family NAD(P)-dependent oxidoreductase [Saccharopolyspora soli]